MKVSLQQKSDYLINPKISSININQQKQIYGNKDSLSFRAGTGVTYFTYKIARQFYKSGKDVKTVHKDLTRANKLWHKEGDAKALYEALNIIAALKTGYDDKFTYFLYNVLKNENNHSIKKMKEKALVEGLGRVDLSDAEGIYVVQNFMTSLYKDNEYCTEDYLKAFSSLPDDKFSGFKKNIIANFLFSNKQELNEPMAFTYNLLFLKSLDKNYYKDFLKEHEKSLSNIPNKMMNVVLSEFKKEKNLAYYYYLNIDYKYNQLKDPMWEDFLQYIFYSLTLSDYKDVSKLAKNLNIDKEFAVDIAKDIETESLVQKAETKEEKMQIYRERINEKVNSGLYKFDLLGSVEAYINQNIYKEEFLKEFKETIDTLRDKVYYFSGVSYDDHPTML